MKAKFSVLIAVLCWTAAAFGQQPSGHESFFGHDSTRWNGVGAISHAHQNYVLRQNSDTVIDSMVYKKVELSEVYWKDGYSEVRDPEHDFFLREDTAYGRLWCRYPGEEDEFLIADMSLQRGDTIVMDRYLGTSESVVFYVRYDKVMDGVHFLYLDESHDNPPSGEYWKQAIFAEGIGNMDLLFHTRLPFWNTEGFIQCIHKDGELVYEKNDYVPFMFENCIFHDSTYVMKHQKIIWMQDLHFDVSQSYAILNARATSGLPIHYVCLDTTIGRISGDTLFLLHAGRSALFAGQDGNEEYERIYWAEYMNALFVTDSTVSIAVEEKPVMRLYPNPTHSTVAIQGATEQIESVRIFDMAGRQVSAFGPAATFDISHLPAGSYIVRIQSADHPDQHLRLIKE